MIRITHIRMTFGGSRPEHIDRLRWVEHNATNTGDISRADLVTWIEQGGTAYVTAGANTVYVRVVNATPKYVQTYADATPTDNLLSLPRF